MCSDGLVMAIVPVYTVILPLFTPFGHCHLLYALIINNKEMWSAVVCTVLIIVTIVVRVLAMLGRYKFAFFSLSL
jgi:small neutral amino acid transporter SnatA (MarC family)